MLSLQPTLSEQDVRRIHEHSLDILQHVGIEYKTLKALEIAEKIAAILNEADKTLLM